MSKLSFALSILVLHFTFHSIQAQPGETKTGTATARAADEVLRYAEAYARSDGSFLLSNLAPGKYWLIARAAPDDDTSDPPVAPIAWDANERAKLRLQAMAAKNEIELQPCGRLKDYVLRFDR